MLDADAIRKKLWRLRLLPYSTVFGASYHAFALAPTLPESEAKAFEEKHGIFLPEEYRAFLTEVGNGGAGPFYGINPLGLNDNGRPLEGEDFGDLQRPFPGPLPVDTPGEEFGPEHLLDGCLQIAHMGCGYYVLLVVSGPLRGSLWEDIRVADGGLRPLLDEQGGRLGFGDWYMAWLRSPLRIPTSPFVQLLDAHEAARERAQRKTVRDTRAYKAGAWLGNVFRGFRRGDQ